MIAELTGAEWVAIILALGTQMGLLLTTYLTKRQVRETHILVNAQSDRNIERTDQLEQALQGSDTDIPPRPRRRH